MIVTDLKGEISAARPATGSQGQSGIPVRARLGQDPSLQSARFHPADRGDRTTDIQNMAAILVPENTESENSIWQATAQQVMAGVISYINESVYYEGRRNLGEVTAFFNSGVNLQALMTLIKEREPYLSRFTVESFNAYIALSERAAASALLDIQKALKPFRNERVVAATTVTDMDLRAMRRRPISIYLAPNITDITLLQAAARPVRPADPGHAACWSRRSVGARSISCSTNSGSSRRWSRSPTKLPYVAGYNIKMAFVIQDLKNLDEIYGETSRHSLIGNCGLSARLRRKRPGHGRICVEGRWANELSATRPNPGPSR